MESGLRRIQPPEGRRKFRRKQTRDDPLNELFGGTCWLKWGCVDAKTSIADLVPNAKAFDAS